MKISRKNSWFIFSTTEFAEEIFSKLMAHFPSRTLKFAFMAQKISGKRWFIFSSSTVDFAVLAGKI